MIITEKAWDKYIKRLRNINDAAASAMAKQLDMVDLAGIAPLQRSALIQYAYNLTQKYGEAAGALSCEMYDALAELSGKKFAAAMPAATPTYQEVAKAVNGTIKTGNPTIVSQAVGRLTKLVGVDSMMQNAIRDGAEWAWIPRGETCAFCIMLASNGWQRASKKAIKDGHAEHVHPDCDCTYAVRFDDSTDVQGYDPDAYYDMYVHQTGIAKGILNEMRDEGYSFGSQDARLNAMRRQFYRQNREKINQQKRDAYARAKALMDAEEADIT